MIHAQVVSDNIMAAVKGEAKVEYNPKPKKRAPDMIVTHGTKGATAEIGGNNGWLMTQVGKSLKAKDLYTKHLWKEYKLQGKPPKTEREMQAGGCFGGGGKKVSPNAKKYQASSSSQW